MLYNEYTLQAHSLLDNDLSVIGKQLNGPRESGSEQDGSEERRPDRPEIHTARILTSVPQRPRLQEVRTSTPLESRVRAGSTSPAQQGRQQAFTTALEEAAADLRWVLGGRWNIHRTLYTVQCTQYVLYTTVLRIRVWSF